MSPVFDPREPQWPDAEEFCRHNQRRESCGRCAEAALADAEDAWWHDSAPSVEQMMRVTDEMLRRLERRAEGA